MALNNKAIESQIRMIVWSATCAFILFTLTSAFLVRRVTGNAYQEQMTQMLDAAQSLTAGMAEQVKRGEISLAEGQASALDALSDIRFGDSGYLYLLTADNHMLMHPIKPELNGKDLSKSSDKAGKLFFNELVRNLSRMVAQTSPMSGRVLGKMMYHQSWDRPSISRNGTGSCARAYT